MTREIFYPDTKSPRGQIFASKMSPGERFRGRSYNRTPVVDSGVWNTLPHDVTSAPKLFSAIVYE